jgi:bla regulator protein BlaR1
MVTLAVLGLAAAAATARQPMPAWQEAAGGQMSFEVAAIHPAMAGTHIRSSVALNIDDESVPPNGHFLAEGTLKSFIDFAYKIMPAHDQEQSIFGALPKWVSSEKFVINATASGKATKDQMRLMMQSLLADRFGLRVHFEIRTEPVFALVLITPGKPEPRIRPHSQGQPCNARWTMPTDRSSPSVAPGGFMPDCGSIAAIDGPDHTVLLGARDASVEQIANYIAILDGFGRQVVDQTGLTGKFDFTLQWTPERPAPPSAESTPRPGSTRLTISEALRDQLGMKLKRAKLPVSTLVIDHIEPPTPN